MQHPSWYFHRLRSMGFAEIVWRVKALLGAQLDVIRLPFGLHPKLNHREIGSFESTSEKFGLSVLPDDFQWNADQQPFIEWQQRLTQKADLICDDKLSFFDLDSQWLGDPINWHRDWSAGTDAPVRLSHYIDYRDFPGVGDCKLVWEPNRHHQLVVLARAYVVTKQQRYASKTIELLLDWIEKNPVGYGMNWKSPLEIGIRLINWVWALDLIRDSNLMDRESWTTIANSAYAAIWDVQRKFSRGSSANNHLIGEAAGVYIATAYFSEFPNAQQWNRASKTILESEIQKQSFEDGCGREHAFGYQYFVLQFLTTCFLVGIRTESEFTGSYSRRLQAMYGFMADLVSDTGIEPGMGDADSGYVLDLGELPVDSGRELISVGGVLFDDSELMLSNNSESAYWLLGQSATKVQRSDSIRGSKAYESSGYFVLRSDSRLENRISVVCDCAELGYGSIAAHGHADALSFTLNVGSLEFLVDSGTYDYFSYPEWRQYFRSTRAHNTVTVDGQCQSVSLGPFLWGQRAATDLVNWHDNNGSTTLVAQHDGYHRLEDPVTHRRSMFLDKTSNCLAISDSLKCKDEHIICRHFHVAPNCHVERLSDDQVAIRRDGKSLHLLALDGDLGVIAAGENEMPGWISRGYHVRKPSHCIVITNSISGNASLTTEIRTPK